MILFREDAEGWNTSKSDVDGARRSMEAISAFSDGKCRRVVREKVRLEFRHVFPDIKTKLKHHALVC